MILYLDTETTGLYPGQICQLSYIMQDKESVKAKNFFFTVDYVEQGAFAVHGFSTEILKELSNGKRFSDCVEEIEKDILCADLVVGHNIAFDYMFIEKEFERLFKDLEIKQTFCTMKNLTSYCKIPSLRGKGYKYPRLGELCERLGISDREISMDTKKLFGGEGGYHDARFDTTACYLSLNYAFANGLFKELGGKL